MWKPVYNLIFLTLMTGLSACLSFNLPPPKLDQTQRCDIPKTDLGLGLTAQSFGDGIYSDIASAIDDNTAPVLYLSGGSQNGAFGAGYLDEWAKNNGGDLPEFAVVTGVSTGAILSLAAFTNSPQATVEGYTIKREGEILDAFVSPNGGDLGLFDYLSALRQGALGDLVPLRDQIRGLMAEYNTIPLLADAARTTNRKLYIAAVDVDTGYAVAFDMTDMARKIVDTPDRREFLTDCFVDAVIASSSVPLASKPVFIDNRMYIDGGARFSIISDQIEAAMGDEKRGYAPGTAPPRNVYMIINGDQLTEPVCGKADETLCTDAFPTGTDAGEHDKWSLIGLAFRSVTILTNQVAEFSQFKIEQEVEEKNDNFFFAKIQPESDQHLFTIAGVSRSCKAWKDLDKQEMSPLEFHPRNMRCLMDYGRKLAREKDW